jgi:hypothetical protein
MAMSVRRRVIARESDISPKSMFVNAESFDFVGPDGVGFLNAIAETALMLE